MPAITRQGRYSRRPGLLTGPRVVNIQRHHYFINVRQRLNDRNEVALCINVDSSKPCRHLPRIPVEDIILSVRQLRRIRNKPVHVKHEVSRSHFLQGCVEQRPVLVATLCSNNLRLLKNVARVKEIKLYRNCPNIKKFKPYK